MESAASQTEGRGETLLLRHCQSFDETRTPAYTRLEATLGGYLTKLLVSALATRLLMRRDDDRA